MLNTQGEVFVESLGAAGTVTGSKHLLRTPELALLIDCGLFQGLKELRLRNWDKLPVDPSDIDVMVLTHAHLDHCGYIPLLAKQGFKGKVYMTPPTKELARVILLDSAKIQEEDAERANREKYSKHDPPIPLYTVNDVENYLKQFVTVDHDVTVQLSENISFRYIKNGHILGSCFVAMKCFGKKIVFSGDIGRFNSGFLAPPEFIAQADFVFMESTYGDRLHDKKDPAQQLEEIITETLQNHGNILISAFAVGRAQEVMKIISELKETNKIPYHASVYLDSPMAADATDILCRYPDWHVLNTTQIAGMCKEITITREFNQTRAIILDKYPKIVIAASGMLTGGRVLEYLKYYGAKNKNAVLLMGYQAEGTRGRDLEEGKTQIKIHGELIEVTAKVVEISGLSAHGDQEEMLQWLHGFKIPPQKIILVHGEASVMTVFKEKIASEIKTEVLIMPSVEPVSLFKII